MPQSGVVPYGSTKTSGFPKDSALRKAWIIAIRKNKFTPTDHSRVCNKHFVEADFIMPKGSLRQNHGVPATSESWAMNRQIKVQDASSVPPDRVPIRPQDLKNPIEQNSINVWQSKWNKQTQQLRSVKPTVEK
ncbi:hypothetical protein JTB14_010591 [Gonioctena quinquepunctata]|nr:hypothetical protein JTB14_010591 [Gonioctena quinquepunctata]